MEKIMMLILSAEEMHMKPYQTRKMIKAQCFDPELVRWAQIEVQQHRELAYAQMEIAHG